MLAQLRPSPRGCTASPRTPHLNSWRSRASAPTWPPTLLVTDGENPHRLRSKSVVRHLSRPLDIAHHILASVEAVYELTTGDDVALRQLIAAQESEVMARYGVHDAGPGLPEDAPCIIARLGGRAVGCVALGRLDSRTGEVKRMYVDPTARGHRIGRLLLKQVEELGRAHGYGALRLEAGTRQPEALRVYDNAGWSRIPCYGYFKDDPTTVCFEKALDQMMHE